MTISIERRASRVVGFLVFFLVAGCSWSLGQRHEGDEGTWGQFRGPLVDGSGTASQAIGDSEAVTLRVAWKVPIGSGYSGVTGTSRTVVTIFSDGSDDVVAAFDAADGRELWRTPLEPTYVGHDGSFNGPISTPLVSGDRVVALGAMGRLVGLSLKSGRTVWSTDLVKDLGAVKPHYGFSTSPVEYAGMAIVQIGSKEAAVAAFDLATGQVRWKAGQDEVAYQTPVSMRVNGQDQLVAAGNKHLLGIDPGSGRVVWDYPHLGTHPRGAQSMVPVVAGQDRIFLTFKDSSSAMIGLDHQGAAVQGKQLWESRSIRNTYTVPLYHEGHLYGFSSRFLTCVSAETGESVWKSRPPGDGFPILLDDRLLILTKKGSLHLAEASPLQYRELAQVKIFDDLVWSPPSLGPGYVLTRSLGELARIDLDAGMAVVERDDPSDEAADTRFARALREIRESPDPASALDRFLESQEAFPIIEGKELVHFVYRGRGEDLAIAGDMIGARQEARMHRLEGTDLFHYSSRLVPDARVNYLFIRDFEQITDPRNPRVTTTGLLGADMEFVFDGSEMDMSWVSMPDWKEPAHLRSPDLGGPRGRLESVSLESKAVKGKVAFQVYLPYGYEQGTRRYPVVYLHGSGAVRRGRIPDSLDNLLGERIAPLIAVMIDSSAAGTEDYARMWAEELVTLIDSRYRTVAEADSRAHSGGDFNAYAALYTAFRYPALAGKIAGQSTAMLDFMRIPLEKLIKTAGKQPLEIYLDWGRYDLFNPDEAWDEVEVNRNLVAFLREQGYIVQGGQVNDGTGWSSWKNRTDVVFETLFPLR